MTNSFNIGDLGHLAQSLLDKAKGQEFMLEDVCNITRAAYERYPEDPVITQVAFTIERMATRAKPGTIINQAEMSKIYNEFVRLSDNSKFRNTIGFLLLGDRPYAGSQNPDYSRLNQIVAEDSNTDDFVDKNLVNDISVAFGGSGVNPAEAFDTKIATDGVGLVKAELKSLGFEPAVEIIGGNSHNIVYAAHFETRKGRVTVAIPTEVNDGRILFPSTFVADDHLEELTPTNINCFVDKKTETEDSSVAGEEGRPDIDIVQDVEMPTELAHLSRDFEDNVLEAVSAFGMEAIRKGKEIIANELRAAGFKNAQVKFGSEGGDSVVYLAPINTPKGPAEIEVPLEMQSIGGERFIPLAPSYFAYDGFVEDFTAVKLQRFAINLPSPSTSNTVYSTAFTYMTLPELKDEILKAASVGDYVNCETALSEIQDKFTEEDFKNSVADYQYILMEKTRASKQEQLQCSKMIPAGKGSVFIRCGHFGVPMHKVVIDKKGYCRLKTAIEREKLNPTEEGGAAISLAKVFMS